MDSFVPVIMPLYVLVTMMAVFFVWKYWKKESLLPEACHYENLMFLIKQSELKLESLVSDKAAMEGVLKDKIILEIQAGNLQQEVLDFQNSKESLEKELQKLSGERVKQEAIHAKTGELQQILAELKVEQVKKQKEKNEQDLKLDACRREIATAKESLNELLEKKSAAHSTLEKIEKSKAQAIDELSDLETKLAELKLEEASLANIIKINNEHLKDLQGRDGELKIMLERRVLELSQLDEALKSHKEQMDKLNATQTVMDDAVSKVLTRPYLEAYPKRTVASEMESLNYLEHCLQSDGLQFDQRTLYRFHTSLKCTAYCPLVVLSGISGTGKTLLAQSYANACGLHFLPMAVQPRWDSPQDLFGYYDFTKKQFAATELSRALLQIDSYSKSQWLHASTPPQWIEDNLLMVLIDEMNIARVEHYFSELLSKLELRKNCTFDENTSRKKAEISLNNCILPVTEQEASLFIDYNVLFVGTLNEDETTLALSDKILDRANVIHFGKPENLCRKKNTATVAKNKSMLSYETWKGWIKDDSSIAKGQKSEIDNMLNDFNRHMSEIGRPFGHRTYQAISVYIANYPCLKVETSWKDALADQVEQKLLTRLRGVDVSAHHNALSEIETLVCSLEDEKLMQRFSIAKENNYFEWK